MSGNTNLFRDNTFTITGKLRLMGRQTAYKYVRLCGGKCSQNVTRRTQILVVGSYEGSSCHRNKYALANRYIEQGQDILIMDELDFYRSLIGCIATELSALEGEPSKAG